MYIYMYMYEESTRTSVKKALRKSCIYICVREYMYTYLYTYTHSYIYIHIHIHVYMCLCIHMYKKLTSLCVESAIRHPYCCYICFIINYLSPSKLCTGAALRAIGID